MLHIARTNPTNKLKSCPLMHPLMLRGTVRCTYWAQNIGIYMYVYRHIHDYVHVYVYVVYDWSMPQDSLSCLLPRKRYSYQFCDLIQNEVKCNIMYFTCKIQNKMKLIIVPLFPLNSANFLLFSQMDSVFPSWGKRHCASATKWFEPSKGKIRWGFFSQ